MPRRTFTPAEIERLKRLAKKSAKATGVPYLQWLNGEAKKEGYVDFRELVHRSKPKENAMGKSAPGTEVFRPGSKHELQKLREQHGPCRSQVQPGPAFAYDCLLWKGHPGEHSRFGRKWTDAEGYMPPPNEIARLEEEERTGTIRHYTVENGQYVEVEDDGDSMNDAGDEEDEA